MSRLDRVTLNLLTRNRMYNYPVPLWRRVLIFLAAVVFGDTSKSFGWVLWKLAPDSLTD